MVYEASRKRGEAAEKKRGRGRIRRRFGPNRVKARG
jgi:hypothetical protein